MTTTFSVDRVVPSLLSAATLWLGGGLEEVVVVAAETEPEGGRSHCVCLVTLCM